MGQLQMVLGAGGPVGCPDLRTDLVDELPIDRWPHDLGDLGQLLQPGQDGLAGVPDPAQILDIGDHPVPGDPLRRRQSERLRIMEGQVGDPPSIALGRLGVRDLGMIGAGADLVVKDRPSSASLDPEDPIGLGPPVDGQALSLRGLAPPVEPAAHRTPSSRSARAGLRPRLATTGLGARSLSISAWKCRLAEACSAPA